MKRIALALAALVAVALATEASIAQEDVEPEKRAAITKMLEITGALNVGLQFGDAMAKMAIQQYRKKDPEAPERIFEIAEEVAYEVLADNLPHMAELVIHIYDRYFTLAQINDVIAFYETPTGQYFIEVMPVIVQESIAAGQEWGQTLEPAITQRMRQRLADEGFIQQ